MTNQEKNLIILGSGLWGTALFYLASRNLQGVSLWTGRSSAETLGSVIETADVLVSAVSMRGVRPTICKLQSLTLPKDLILVTATKGLDPLTTHTPCQLWHEAFPDHPRVVLSGPNLSEEIQRGLPAATVVASEDEAAAEIVQNIFASDNFRVYYNDDPIGTELGGTLKNVVAIAAGVCDGLQLGTNAKAGLLTRAMPEMIRVGTHLGAKPATFFGLSGLGDLLATCNSPLSRNYRVGYGLAQGKSLEEVLIEIQSTAEGVYTTEVLIKLAHKESIYVPIAEQVYSLLQGQITPQEAVKALIKRELKSEFVDLNL